MRHPGTDRDEREITMEKSNLDELLTEPVESSWVVGGFQFDNAEDAQTARQEQLNIETLKNRIDLTNEDNMLALYCKLAEKRVFRTPVGFQFLGEFRDFLTGDLKMEEEKLPVIYVPPGRGISRAQQEQLEFLQNESRQFDVQKRKYLITIGVLIFIIVAMFVITILNPNVGYINTENKILNRYAGWEEELTKREARIREREAELGIDSPAESETGQDGTEE